jgi:electron transport complex protein RnfC
MKANTFKRGLTVPTHKGATEGTAVPEVPLPSIVYIPVSQGGAPNKPIVAVGDVVKRGQRIAEGAAPGIMTVPVHASVSGTVKRIEDRTLSTNAIGPCIVIERDPARDNETDFLPPLDPFSCTKEEALARIRDAGLVGMGGAGFPMHVKLSPRTPVDTIIGNGAECEPYLTTDEAALSEKPDKIVKGLAIIMHITNVKHGILGMEDNKAALVPLVQREINLLKDNPATKDMTISIGLCRTRYPQGGEKMLINALTGREVPSGKLPADAGCIVQNVGTLSALAEAFFDGKPLIDRELTVTGGACKTPKNIRAPIGTLVTDLPPEFMSFDMDKARKILFGGPMMGVAVPKLDIPIQKNTSGIVCMTAEETTAFAEGPCIRCSRCVKNCPMRLSPVLMNDALKAGNLQEAMHYGLMDCIECGSCSFMCPARIKLTQRFRVGKGRWRTYLAAEKAKAAAKQAAAAKEAK